MRASKARNQLSRVSRSPLAYTCTAATKRSTGASEHRFDSRAVPGDVLHGVTSLDTRDSEASVRDPSADQERPATVGASPTVLRDAHGHSPSSGWRPRKADGRFDRGFVSTTLQACTAYRATRPTERKSRAARHHGQTGTSDLPLVSGDLPCARNRSRRGHLVDDDMVDWPIPAWQAWRQATGALGSHTPGVGTARTCTSERITETSWTTSSTTDGLDRPDRRSRMGPRRNCSSGPWSASGHGRPEAALPAAICRSSAI
jgi:hypothetical protein